ncbi:hypothetical protein ETAA8_21160 [Anatilimnocola aggregata]|uniref:DUF192 domain-containing protein n=1 Tax=Anatilimnocola aggregata TaxID=2528021 RepID=A0A517YA52_9BACT|nr:hypothetical protein ETAA8_21160 [Anatilimnocola aggregata]
MQARLHDRNTGKVLVEHLQIATTFSERFWGLQFRRELPPRAGLLIAPCNSIHSCWMRFSIDAVFLSPDGTVLAVKSNVRPWRATYPVWGAACVVEVSSGTVATRSGDRLYLSLYDLPAASRGKPPSLIAGLLKA